MTKISFTNWNRFDEYTYADDRNEYYVTVGSDVWIGTDVKLLSGVDIGDGAIIAAGAVVTTNIPPYAIVGGVPAKVIKYRFASSDIEILSRSKWWEKDPHWIKENADLFSDIDLLRGALTDEIDCSK